MRWGELAVMLVAFAVLVNAAFLYPFLIVKFWQFPDEYRRPFRFWSAVVIATLVAYVAAANWLIE